MNTGRQSGAESKRSTRCSQAGFTLIELLVVISILGVLGGVSVGTFSHVQSKARLVGLDQSLRSLSTAVDSQIILENMTVTEAYESVVDPGAGFLKEGDSIAFTVTAPTSGTFIVQARYKGQVDPCRQLDLMGGEPGACDSTSSSDEAAMKAEEEAKRKAEEEAKRKADDDAKNKAEEEAKRKAEADEQAKVKAEQAASEKAKAEEEARLKAEQEANDKAKAEEEARKKAEEDAKRKAEEEAKTPKEFRSSITKRSSEFNWWNGKSSSTNGEGEWVATFDFANSWIRGQELDLKIVKTYAEGGKTKQKTSWEKGFWVPASSSSTLKLWDNELEVDDAGAPEGVIAVEVTITKIVTSTEDWKKTTSKVDGPMARVELPPLPR